MKRQGLVLLAIDPVRVRAEIRWEPSEPWQLFPHVYGPLDLDAVVTVLPFEPGPEGTFSFPSAPPLS